MAMKKAIAKKPAHLSQQFSTEEQGFKGRSDLSRLSTVLGNYLEESRQNHSTGEYASDAEGEEEEFRMSHSIADPVRRRQGADIDTDVTEYDASDMLTEYRKNRDRGQDQPFSRQDIRDAVAERDMHANW